MKQFLTDYALSLANKTVLRILNFMLNWTQLPK